MTTTTICPVCETTFTRVHTAEKPPVYCSRACANRAPGRMTPEVRKKIARAGADHPNFKGGYWNSSKRSTRRYYMQWVPTEERPKHPTVTSRGYVHRSHFVWNTAHPNDPVIPGQLIHHINEDSEDDRLENLEKMASQVAHARHHFSKPRKPLSEAHKRAISETKRKKAS